MSSQPSAPGTGSIWEGSGNDRSPVDRDIVSPLLGGSGERVRLLCAKGLDVVGRAPARGPATGGPGSARSASGRADGRQGAREPEPRSLGLAVVYMGRR